MLVDYHVHTPHCGHALGRTVDYVERAVACGLSQLTFTDHLYRYYLTPVQRARFGEWGMDEPTVERYIRELQGLRAMYAGAIDIRFGLEVDFVQGAEQTARDILQRYPLDFVVGSVHCLPHFGWHHLVRYNAREPADLYREYFSCARAALASGLFDSLAHLDFAWRNIPWPAALTAKLQREIEDVVSLARDSAMCMEINANGYLWSTLVGKDLPNPYETMVNALASSGVPVTIGSDAHTPTAVGSSFGEIAAYLSEHGIRECATFRRRQRTMVEISPPTATP